MSSNKRRISAIWSLSKEDLQKLLNEASSYRDVLKKLGFTCFSSHSILKRRMREEDLSSEKIDLNRSEERRKKAKERDRPSLDEVLIENSSYSRNSIKTRLLSENRLKYECSECGNTGQWKDKKLTLQLDHINGVNNDNRRENLRLLCPNCHSQTDTHGAKNWKREKIKGVKSSTCQCGNKMLDTSEICRECFNKKRPCKIKVSKEELIADMSSMSLVKVGKKHGVTDNCVRKHCARLGIKFPKRGSNKNIQGDRLSG